MTSDAWDDGSKYEPFMGRWSGGIAERFVAWLGLPANGAWLDVGCGTGALCASILAAGAPRLVVGCDRSAGYVDYAAGRITDERARFAVAEIAGLPRLEEGFDAVVSGLVLNFLPDPAEALRAMAARARRGGTVAIYVWDYAGQMQMLRRFWDAAVALDAAAGELDEGHRFPICAPAALEGLFTAAGLENVRVGAIDAPTIFRSFNDYWQPFLGGQGPAPGYARSLSPEALARLRESVRARLPVAADGAIPLVARAWAVRGAAA
jgi:SAM-dependent methyltransferase